MINKTILVTGAPRSGTTPLGQILSTLPGAVELYEPMGPTGDQRFTDRFPIPGEPGFTADDLRSFIHDMQNLKLHFKAQNRPSQSKIRGLVARAVGSRTLSTYRRAQVTRRRDLVVCKDPHAVFCASEASNAGFRAVVSMRSPEAHAASFKRLGWISRIDEIYPRYRSAFGEVAGFSDWVNILGTTQ
jgi:ribosomal protein S15P/S13E